MNWKLKTYGGVLANDKLWFSNNTFNGLFYVDLKDYRIHLETFFPQEEPERVCIHKKCLKYMNFLIFLPNSGNHIHIFNTDTKEISLIPFETACDDGRFDKVSDAVLIDDRIYIFPFRNGGDLYELSMRDMTLQRISEFRMALEEERIELQKFIVTRCQSDNHNNIYTGIYDTDVITCWNVEKNKLDVQHTGVPHIFSAHIYEDDFLILPITGNNVYQYSNEQEIIKLQYGNPAAGDGKRVFNGLAHFGCRYLLLPAFLESLTRLENNTIRDVCKLNIPKVPEPFPSSFGAVEAQEMLWILPFNADDAYLIASDLSMTKTVSFELTDKADRERITENIMRKRMKTGILTENEDMNLCNFVHLLENETYKKKELDF